jgi:hypothetical protein
MWWPQQAGYEGAMAIEELLKLVAPPATPVEAGGAARWAEVEQSLGSRLPSDLRDFATHYGSGYFVRPFDVNVFNPFDPSYLGQIRGRCVQLRTERGLAEGSGKPYGVFPDRPGWLPWGWSERDGFCWVTEGEPEDWPLLLISDRCKNFQQLQMPMTSFLARLFSGQLRPFFVVNAGIRLGKPAQFVQLQRQPAFDSRLPQPVLALETARLSLHPYPWKGEWFPPDTLGRPTGARVVLGPGSYHNFWNGFSAVGFTVCPDWWQELPEPRRKWRRGQLLGWRLGGPGGTALHNLVPLTWFAQRILWSQEIGAATSVCLGAHISYSVQAMYEGTNRYPSRIAFEYEHLPGSPGSGKVALSFENK